MSEFNAIIIEGVCWQDADHPVIDIHGNLGSPDLMVDSLIGERVVTRSLYTALGTLIGQRIQIAYHHLPPMPPDPHRWGGGSCLWQATGHCPAGHHVHPMKLTNLAAAGVLVFDLDHSTSSGGWWLEQFDGSRLMLPFATDLVGHHVRVAAATMFAVETMRDVVAASGLADHVDALSGQISDMKGMLSRIKSPRQGNP